MPLPFDATTKDLARRYPEDYVLGAGLPTPPEARTEGLPPWMWARDRRCL